MNNIRLDVTRALGRLIRDERGATAIEYAIIAAGVSVAVAGTVWGLGSALSAKYQAVQNAFPG